ncbi:unnamed protein product, partial [Iphiclides podalirius]
MARGAVGHKGIFAPTFCIDEGHYKDVTDSERRRGLYKARLLLPLNGNGGRVGFESCAHRLTACKCHK